MTLICDLEHVFTASTAGTPPFEFGLRIRVPDDPDPGELQVFTDAAAAAYEDNLKQYLTSDLGSGNAFLTVPDPAGEVTYEAPLLTGTGAGDTTPPGCSFRIIFTAPRPPKSRNNGCYLPLASPGHYDADGSVHADVKASVIEWGTEILASCSTLGYDWVAIHQVGGPTAPIVARVVTGAVSAPTVSFLRKRYR